MIMREKKPRINMLGFDIDDPVKFVKCFWPHIKLYEQQAEIMRSVRDNDETYVPAANMMGKDFIAALTVLWFFFSRPQARVITTSVDGDQLYDVLWGELRRFIASAVWPKKYWRDGKPPEGCPLPVVDNHLHLRKLLPDGSVCPVSLIKGRVAEKGAGMLGRHLASIDGRPTTLFVFDEASAIDDTMYESIDTWADRKLAIGNCWPCVNFFFRHVEEGDKRSKDGSRYYRKVIRIKAEQSPNVILRREVIPGVINLEKYEKRREVWDPKMQCIGLDAAFYKGQETMLYPEDWLNAAETLAESLGIRTRRVAKAMGVDSAAGGDKTAWSIVDDLGLIHQLAIRTPDTTVVQSRTVAFIKEFGIQPENVYFDAGGGGTEHANYLRRQGYKVRTIAFGGAASDPNRFKRMRTSRQKADDSERRMVYKNRRAEMYGLLRELLNPSISDKGFGLPLQYRELRRQLKGIPLLYDQEGRLFLPPKRKLPGATKNAQPSLTDILGCSPDEADSLVLGVFGLFNADSTVKVGVAF